jgi:hypothetical protein
MHRLFSLKLVTIVFCFGAALFLFSLGGCRKPEPARLIVSVQGQLFSDALVIIDGKQTGKLTQTLIQPDGKLLIDRIYNVTLPPGHRDIPEKDNFEGTLDSLEVKTGQHVILLQADDGTTLQITADIPPGRHLVTYFSDEGKLTWNNIKLDAAPGSSVTVKP